MNDIDKLKSREHFLWINPNKISSEKSLPLQELSLCDIREAEERLKRFAPLLVKFFPELEVSGGIVRSDLIGLDNMASILAPSVDSSLVGRFFLKGDHALPVSGSIKARGGFYAVFVIVERILSEHGLDASDLKEKSTKDIKSIFSSRSLVVGSTGNLGLSIGLIGRAFGFNVTVHMSSDAKKWKKDRLKTIGVHVIEYESDYTAACRAARSTADGSEGVYFIDDENSGDLFLGYSTAASELKIQLEEKEIPVDPYHPLFVYIPCGVGGAPGGITFGLKHLFGDNVHCFFAEPVEAPAMMLGLVTGKNSSIAVKDIGLSINTCADGLAVGTPSELVAKMMSTILDGCFSVQDSEMLIYLAELYDREGIKIEPSAAAGFAGPRFITSSETGKEYLAGHTIEEENITHVVWTTGGSMEPEEEFMRNYKEGLALIK